MPPYAVERSRGGRWGMGGRLGAPGPYRGAMLVTLSVLGKTVLEFQVDRGPRLDGCADEATEPEELDEDEPERPARRFGFCGGSALVAERADGADDDE